MTIKSSQPMPMDAGGLLDDAAFDQLAVGPSYAVFAQQRDARIDVAAWQRHAAQFFATDLMLTRPKQYGTRAPTRDGAHIVLTPRGGTPVLRSVLLRPRTQEDTDAAQIAEAGGGLALLASRCPMVALVPVEPDGTDLGSGSLRLAALLSSLLLGPILTPDGARLLGARSARRSLELITG